MSAISQSTTLTRVEAEHNKSMPFLQAVTALTWRTLVNNFRVPAAVLPGIIISLFFLIIYEASLGGASNFLPGLAGKSYLGFILPLSVISSALSGASLAGESIVRDIESGYFDKLMLTPVNRAALVLGPMIAGAMLLGLQTLVVIGTGLVLGLNPATGALGLAALVGYALLLGMAFSGFTVGIALFTGSGAATQGASFLFFPLSFLTATFVPLELLNGWIRTAAEWNPITYILGATRSLMLDGWQADQLIPGLIACAIMGGVLFTFASFGLRSRVKRR